MSKSPIKFYFVSAFLLNIAAFIFLLWEIIRRYPVNHVGYDPLWFLGLSVLSLGCLAAPLFFPERKRLVITVWSGLVLWVAVVTEFNILLEYNAWLSKGMPAWGEFWWAKRGQE